MPQGGLTSKYKKKKKGGRIVDRGREREIDRAN